MLRCVPTITGGESGDSDPALVFWYKFGNKQFIRGLDSPIACGPTMNPSNRSRPAGDSRVPGLRGAVKKIVPTRNGGDAT